MARIVQLARGWPARVWTGLSRGRTARLPSALQPPPHLLTTLPAPAGGGRGGCHGPAAERRGLGARAAGGCGWVEPDVEPWAPFVVGVLQPMSLPPSSAPTATGWSDSCRAGFAPAEEWRLVTAHRPPRYRIQQRRRSPTRISPGRRVLAGRGGFQRCDSAKRSAVVPALWQSQTLGLLHPLQSPVGVALFVNSRDRVSRDGEHNGQIRPR